jgi:hypothetical protein
VKEAGETLDPDLSNCSFEQFVAYAFDRPVSVEPGGGWWWEEPPLLVVDPELQLRHATRLFREPAVLKRFTERQIDQGLWFMAMDFTPVAKFFAEPLRNTDLGLELRLNCVRAMFDLYDKLLSSMESGTAAEMWWDLLSDGPPDEPLRLEMLRTLARTLEARLCEKAALHGLSHLARTQEREPVIDRFLQTEHDPSLTTYALRCRSGAEM